MFVLREEREEFVPLACECSALRVHLDLVQGYQLNRQPLDLYGLVRFMKADRIDKAMERRTEQVKFTGGLATPGHDVH